MNRPAQSRQPGSGRRRGHRGGRGRGPRRAGPTLPPAPPMGMSSEEAPPPRQKSPAPAHARTASSAISQAVNEVMQIVESLRQALNQMEDVLELVEVAERQKLGDEREIESLRRALRQLQQPRGGRGERREHDV